MIPIRRPSEFIRLGAWRAVMLAHHKRRATAPGDSESRPSGRVIRFLGASGTLVDAAGIAGGRLPAEETDNAIVWVPYVGFGPLERMFLGMKPFRRRAGIAPSRFARPGEACFHEAV